MADDLRIALSTDRSTYAPGEPIRMTLRLSNDSGDRVVLRFASAQRYDFAILDTEGAEVWRWSEGHGFIQMLGEERVAPGAELVYRETFEGTLPAGRYRLEGTLTALERPRTAAIGFEVDG